MRTKLPKTKRKEANSSFIEKLMEFKKWSEGGRKR